MFSAPRAHDAVGVAVSAEEVAVQRVALDSSSSPVGQLLVAVLPGVGKGSSGEKTTYCSAVPHLTLIAVNVVVLLHGNHPQASFLPLKRIRSVIKSPH